LDESLLDQYNSGEAAELQLISTGDQYAFTRIVDRYWNKVYSHALAYVKSPPKAQELTQDIFLKVWNQRTLLRDVANFPGFLFTMGKNEIISSMRRKLAEPARDILDFLDTQENFLVPYKQLEYKQTYSQVMEAIEKLPPTRRKIFKLSRLEGKTYDDIARELKISKHTVKEHIVLALNFLRTYVYTHTDLAVAYLVFMPISVESF